MHRAVLWFGVLVSMTATSAWAEWRYKETRDALRDQVSNAASIDSTNSIQQDFPYQGDTTLTLTLVRSNKGNEVSVRLSKGQLTCGRQKCGMNMRFDEGRVIELDVPSLSGSANIFYFDDRDGLVSTAVLADKVTIEVPVLGRGMTPFHFDLSGLAWEVETAKGNLLGEVGGHAWSEAPGPEVKDWPVASQEEETVCYRSPDRGEVFGATPRTFSLCYFRDMQYMAEVHFRQRDAAKVRRAVSEVAGEPKNMATGYSVWEKTEASDLSLSLLGGIMRAKYLPVLNLVPDGE